MIKTKISKLFLERSPEKLMMLPVTITVNSFTESSAKEFREAMADANDTNQPIIPIVIDSYGGQVYSLLSMVSTIRASKIPVATIVTGKAMSCGAVLMTCGAEGHRYISQDATVMIHDVSSGTFGKVKEMKADAEEADRLNAKIYEIMAHNCGKDTDYFSKIVHAKGHADWYLTPQEAIKHNLANAIKVPTFQVNASVSMKLV